MTTAIVAEPPRGAAAGGRRLRLAGAGGAPGRRSRRGAPADQPLAPRAPHFAGPGPAGDLPVHAGRPVAGRHVRPQAAPDPRPRQALAEALPGPDKKAAGLALEVPQAGRVRPRGERALSARRGVCRSAVRDPLDGRRRRQPPRRLPADEHGRAGGHAAEPGRLGDLRPGHREPEPARLHRHRPGAADRGRAAVRRRASCRPPTRARSCPT